MKFTIIPSILFLIVVLSSCGSSGSSQKMEPVRDSVQSNSAQPTTIKPNGSFVSVRVDSIILLDGFNYRVYGKIVSALDQPGMIGFAVPNQEINVIPEYFLDANGMIDFSNEKNKNMLEFRNAKPGEAFMGNISLQAKKGWVITFIMAIIHNQ